MSSTLEFLQKQRKEPGRHSGIYSVCAVHPLAIRAAMRQARQYESPLLIEATSNQVNQFVGYTGMRPRDFRRLVAECAEIEKLSMARIILGGDHLGPNPWHSKAAVEAMELAEDMIADAREGFQRIHIDASMACDGDPPVLSPQVVAERSARLCSATESVDRELSSLFVIGTEVPSPGDTTEEIAGLHVTGVPDAEQTLEVHRKTFRAHGLDRAWRRVIAMVVQPGVEFNHDSVHEYDPGKTSSLSAWIDEQAPPVFEAHSADYQRPESYQQLVNGGFAILRVGPAITFAMREAFYALADIEEQLLPTETCSCLREAIESAILESLADWQSHYHGTAEQQRVLRRFSYSDRLRYYWQNPRVQEAAGRLFDNLSTRTIPETLLSAYLPNQYVAVRGHEITPQPAELVIHACQAPSRPYASACFEGVRLHD